MKILNKEVKMQKNFWNHCIFHPTDAVEDAWGKRILDKMAEDKAIQTVRIYAMLEDIVYLDEDGNLAYDFRVNDVRLDYLVEKGYDILIAYGMLPEIMASDPSERSSVSKNSTRYKGKRLYVSKPKNVEWWEEICYEYTKHIVERYGVETVSKWHLHCFNEPDIGCFFIRNATVEERLEEYFKLYQGFAAGILRVSDKLHFGGPALAGWLEFLDGFLKKVKENNLRLDYIALHNYAGTSVDNATERGFCVQNWLDLHETLYAVLEKNGFADAEIVYDEWGMSAQGFRNIEECPAFIARENEVFSAYYAKLIHEIIRKNYNINMLMICLSGQHEMVTDFSGFRNFFTLNFIKKPIYNAYVLAGKLGNLLLEKESKNENIFVVPTKNDNGDFATLITYSDAKFTDNLPEIEETVEFEQDISDKTVTIWCIDKNTTNPYRMFEKMGVETPDEAQLKLLREEGKMKPVKVQKGTEKITLKLTPNATFLITVQA